MLDINYMYSLLRSQLYHKYTLNKYFYAEKMTTPLKLQGTGLEDVRIPGQTFLRDALTSCTDPLKAIETFQVYFLSKFYL